MMSEGEAGDDGGGQGISDPDFIPSQSNPVHFSGIKVDGVAFVSYDIKMMKFEGFLWTCGKKGKENEGT